MARSNFYIQSMIILYFFFILYYFICTVTVNSLPEPLLLCYQTGGVNCFHLLQTSTLISNFSTHVHLLYLTVSRSDWIFKFFFFFFVTPVGKLTHEERWRKVMFYSRLPIRTIWKYHKKTPFFPSSFTDWSWSHWSVIDRKLEK